MNRFLKVFQILAVVSLFTAAAYAQGNSSLKGTVTDPNGGTVAGAKVTATNVATNVSTDTVTNGDGLYNFPTLPVGNYTVSIEQTGFKRSELKNVVLTVGHISEYDVKLDVGAPAETVTVTAGGEQLAQVAESSVSTLLAQNTWKTFPLENRDTNEFMDLMPGAVPNALNGSTRGAAVNGARGGMGNFLVEGYDNNDQGQGGRGSTVAGGVTSISPEAIQEYRVITNNYSAQYGKAGGFVTDTVLKSGTNQWHGSLFEYNRVQALAANDFFSNREGINDSLVRNQFGGSLGGPIKKDKTFIFGTAEFNRLRQGFPLTATSTTSQFINFVQTGAFATFMESSPNGFCMQNFGAACPGGFAHSRTLGPIFTSLRASNFFPLATSNFTNEAAGLFTGDAVGFGFAPLVYPVPVYGQVTISDKVASNQKRFSIKADHNRNENDRYTATFLWESFLNTDAHAGGDTTIGPEIDTPGMSLLTGISNTHTFNPTTINEAKISYLRHTLDFPQCPGTEGQPSVVTGIDPLGVGFGCTSNLPQFFTDNQFQLQDMLSKIWGNHSLKTGVEYRRIRNGSAFEAVKNGFFLPHGVEELLTDGFFGDEADLLSFGAPVVGGFTFAQASINPQNGTRPEYYRGFRANEWAAFIQDDWKFRSRLTLNLGLRWEYFGPPHNFRPGIDSNFYFGDGSTPVPNPSANLFFPTTSPLAAEVARGSFQQKDHEIWRKDFNNFAPRVGFAWDVFGTQKLVVRGGGAISYDRIWNNLFENIRFNAPFFSFATVGFFGGGAGQPAGPLVTPGLYANPFTPANTARFNNPAFNPVPSPRHMDENLSTPYIQQFNIGAQWEFVKNFLFEANYINTGGRSLTGIIDINTFDGRGRGGSSRRINPSLGGDNFRTNAFKSTYNGGQFVLRNRLWKGLQFNANYTFAKAIDLVSDAFNNRSGTRPTDNQNIFLDRGRADFDIRHRFVFGGSYNVPLFEKNRWLGGWVLTGIAQLNSGVPFSVFSGEDANADGYTTDRLVFLGNDYSNAYTTSGSPADGFLNPAMFEGMITRVNRFLAAAGSNPTARTNAIIAACGPGNGVVISATPARWWCNGTSGRNVFTGPSFANVDLGVHKNFKLTESVNLQLQANAFNVFNHTNFAIPVNNLDDPNFGKSRSTVGTPRVMQLAIRLDF